MAWSLAAQVLAQLHRCEDRQVGLGRNGQEIAVAGDEGVGPGGDEEVDEDPIVRVPAAGCLRGRFGLIDRLRVWVLAARQTCA